MDSELTEQEKENEKIPGVLALLRRLQLRARSRALRDERRLRRLRRLRELRAARDRLRGKLRHEPGAAAAAAAAALRWRIGRCRERLRLFQLTGLSAHLSPSGVSFSLHAACQGRLLGSFHLRFQGFPPLRETPGGILEFPQIPPGDPPAPFRLRRHSLPPAVPLEPLRRELLPRRPRAFLGNLLALLRAQRGRSRQLRQAQEQFPNCIQGTPSGNSLCNLLSFRYRIPAETLGEIPGEIQNIPKKNENIPKKNENIPKKNENIPQKNENIPQKNENIPKNPENIPGNNADIPEGFLEFRARLLYGDPLRWLPTDVAVAAVGDAAPPPRHRELLLSRALPRALRDMGARPATGTAGTATGITGTMGTATGTMGTATA